MNSSWHEICANPKAIELHFALVPPLEDFDVLEFGLKHKGTSVTFGCSLPRVADKPSPLWDTSATHTWLFLSLWNISNLSLIGSWCPSTIGKLAIIRLGDLLKFRFANANLQCSGVFEFAMIDQLSGYHHVCDEQKPRFVKEAKPPDIHKHPWVTSTVAIQFVYIVYVFTKLVLGELPWKSARALRKCVQIARLSVEKVESMWFAKRIRVANNAKAKTTLVTCKSLWALMNWK